MSDEDVHIGKVQDSMRFETAGRYFLERRDGLSVDGLHNG